MFEDAPWDVAYDRQFQTALEELDTSSGDLKDNVSKTVRAIVDNPLKGDPKTGQLRGCRTTHVEHLVVVWELEPEVISAQHLDKVQQIYFHNIKHHDKMKTAIANKAPVNIPKQFEVTFESLDVQATISRLYDCEQITIDDQTWNEDGVIIQGTFTDDDTITLEALLPETATITLTTPSLP